MYSVYCDKCGVNRCRMLDIELNNDEYQAVVVDDKKFAITTIKRIGCSCKVSIGIMNVSTKELINPHNSILLERFENEEAI